jgi:hypothetical protein
MVLSDYLLQPRSATKTMSAVHSRQSSSPIMLAVATSLCRSPIALLIEMDHVFHRCRFLTDSLSAAQKTAFPQ